MTSQPDTTQLNNIAQQAERDLNSYESKTGNNRDKKTGLEDAGVSDVATKKFPGSSVKYSDDLVTNAGMNRRIPPDEGGDVDDHGRFLRGSAYTGPGGPEDKIASAFQLRPGSVDEAALKRSGLDPRAVAGRDVPAFGEALDEQQYHRDAEAPRSNETIEQGRRAAKANLGRDENDAGEVPSQGKESQWSAFRGADYELAGSVPDRDADMGNIKPASAVGGPRRVQGEND
ncbi:hypothetical protein QBC34DRAFT_495924 [Podospora aff. communis PSN243]|uniref:Uncharacterized protein n=1 Tax=Podospora aff. communis PSN243 TaxID=3040156 RepID=A0AAV9GIL2_9PEZI|nr:hypothetical protein QBC34DRAFT_495924 [Podospora aff. communis PSN243]